MRFLILALLSFNVMASPVYAYFTGRVARGKSISGEYGYECEYQYQGKTFVVFSRNYCAERYVVKE